MMKKTIVTDFDGTFSDGNIIQNIEEIYKFINEGNQFVIATGRTFQSIKNAIKKYNIPYDYLITSDGAAIYDMNDNLLYERLMPNLLKYDIIDLILKTKFKVNIKFDDNNYLTDKINKISRIIVYGSLEDKSKLCELLNDNFKDVYAYLSETCLDITYKYYNKLEAIKFLEESNKLNKIYTIGNDKNDFGMIDYYNGYLVGINNQYQTVSSFKNFIKKIST